MPLDKPKEVPSTGRRRRLAFALYVLAVILGFAVYEYRVYVNMLRGNVLFNLQHNVIRPYYDKHGMFPPFDSNGQTWRDALRAGQPPDSLISRECFIYYRLFVFGVDGPWAPWGMSREDWGKRLETQSNLFRPDGRPSIPYPLIVAVPAPYGADLNIENDIWSEDPFRLIRAESGGGRIWCIVLGTDLSVSGAYLDPTAGREIVRNGRFSGIWKGKERTSGAGRLGSPSGNCASSGACGCPNVGR